MVGTSGVGVRTCRERAGVNHGIRVKDLRHSAVSFAVAHGADIYSIQRMVGHSKPSITLDVYGELWDTSQEQLAAKLDEAIRVEAQVSLLGKSSTSVGRKELGGRGHSNAAKGSQSSVTAPTTAQIAPTEGITRIAVSSRISLGPGVRFTRPNVIHRHSRSFQR